MQAKNIIKDTLNKENLSLTQVLAIMDSRNDTITSLANVSNKLNRNTIKYSDVQSILHAMGYELVARKVEPSISPDDSFTTSPKTTDFPTEAYIKKVVDRHLLDLLLTYAFESDNSNLCDFIKKLQEESNR